MALTRRIYVSLPTDRRLPDAMNDLKWAIVDEIENLSYTPEIFTNPKGKPGLAPSRAWGARDAEEVARRYVGAAIIGMARWTFQDDDQFRLWREHRDYVWSYDFVEDRTHDDRRFRMLNVVDEFTRECLAIRVARKLKALSCFLRRARQ